MRGSTDEILAAKGIDNINHGVETGRLCYMRELLWKICAGIKKSEHLHKMAVPVEGHLRMLKLGRQGHGQMRWHPCG